MENLFPIIQNGVQKEVPEQHHERKPFIEANSVEVALNHLQKDCIIPVFSKDNERTISHQEFIDTTMIACSEALGGLLVEHPESRVSHQIKGRTPEAIHKPVKDLLEHEKTIYYERMAFIARIPSIEENIGGNPITLTIGGVRSYNLENLYQRKSSERFKVFIGFQNLVCCNLCVSTDGFIEEMRASNLEELFKKIYSLIESYRAEKQLEAMRQLFQYNLTEHQFAQFIGRCKLYQALPKHQKKLIPELSFTDSQFNTVVNDYYHDESFSKNELGDINIWKLYNLFTQANKSSYIDTFLQRNLNALQISQGLVEALDSPISKYDWFLS